jgi:hypothetical protein
MMIGDQYWSTFLTEEHTLEEKLAWIAAYTLYLSESPNRIGWCQKKADDDYGQFMGQTFHAELEQILDGIDRQETDDPPGWWETSTGAKFGQERLRLIKEAFKQVQ